MGSDKRWWALNLILQSAIFIETNRIASLEAFANLIKFEVYKYTKFQELRCYH